MTETLIHTESRSQIFFMLISGAVFAYFGFGTTWNYYSGIDGRFLLFVALLDWTLKGTAIGCGLSIVLTMINPMIGNVVYSLVGLIGAILFIVVAAMDVADTQHTAMSPILLFIFAAWNGYGSWVCLHDIIVQRRRLSGA